MKDLKGIYDVSTNTIKGNASCFIIPNSPGPCKSFICSADRNFDELKKWCDMNGDIELDMNTTPLIQVWWHSNEYFGTDNMYRHGCSVPDTEGHDRRFDIDTPEYMPLTLLEKLGAKEGAVVDIKVPCRISKLDGSGYDECVAEIKLEFDQLHYRYGRFGSFEEVLKKLL